MLLSLQITEMKIYLCLVMKASLVVKKSFYELKKYCTHDNHLYFDYCQLDKEFGQFSAFL